MKSFLITYKRYIVLIIVVVFFRKMTSVEVGPGFQNIPGSYQSDYSNETPSHDHMITGVMVDGPSGAKTRSQWVGFMGQNNDYMKGRIYDITDRTVKKWLLGYSKKVPTTLIVEDNKYSQYDDSFGNLQKEFRQSPITLYPDKNLRINNTHAKTFVGDKRRVIQTANLNRSSFYNNREHFFFGTDNVIRKNLLDLFALDEKTITTQQKYKNEYKSLAKTFSPYLVVCPLDCRAKIENLLSGAQSSIWVSTQYITDEAIINILRNKATTIDLRILTNDMESNRDLVRYFGKDVVRFENPKSYNHDKMIIIDKKKLLIGSTNLSTNALDHNREISIITTDTGVINSQLSLFD